MKLLRGLLGSLVLFLPTPATSQVLSNFEVRWNNLLVQGPSNSSPVDVPTGTNENWQAGLGASGTNGRVHASLWVDGHLYIAGDFTSIAGEPTVGIAEFDGDRWMPLGEGVVGTVYSLLSVGDILYVGGDFTHAGGIPARDIVSYNRRTGEWKGLGKGIGGLFGSRVQTLAWDGHRLYAGGFFIVAGTTVAVNIAAWDGTSWKRVGTGADRIVHALAFDGDYLYAGGEFQLIGDRQIDRVARYTPETDSWEALPGVTFTENDAVACIAFDDRYIYIGGRFSQYVGSSFNNVARFHRTSGEWDGMLGGVTNQRKSEGAALEVDGDGVGPIVVKAMAMRGTDLFIGGDIDNIVSNPRTDKWDAGNQPRDMAKWSTVNETWSMFPRTSAITGWHHPSSGVIRGHRKVNSLADFRNYAPRDDHSTDVLTFASGEGDAIYIGGNFDVAGPIRVSGDVGAGASQFFPDPEAVFAANICMLSQNDTLWSQVGGTTFDAEPHALADDGGYVYAGGKFLKSGSEVLNHVARRLKRSGRWVPMDGGVTGPGAVVEAVEPYRGKIYVGGRFTRAGDLSVSGLVEWDPVSESWSTVGGRSFSGVTGLADDGEILAVVGDHGLSLWDGSDWEDIPDTIAGQLYDVEIDGRNVYVGGRFTAIGSMSAKNIAVFNRDTRGWDNLSGGIPGVIYAIEAWNEYIYFGGDFYFGGAVDIVRWNRGPKRWEPVGTGLIRYSSDSSAVFDLHVSTWGLYAAGYFGGFGTGAVTNNASGVALWDGTAWQTLGNGLARIAGQAHARALASDSERLHVAGTFDFAGVKPASMFSEWIFPLPNERPSDEDRPIQLTSSSVPHPDDIFWDDRFNPDLNVPGLNSEVFSIVSTPDGRGVYIGGTFSSASGIDLSGVAYWDGSDWQQLHDGADEGVDGFVFAMAVDGDDLYVGGQFTQAGGIPARNIARWDGRTKTWHALGSGLELTPPGIPYVADIVFVDGKVFVGGSFDRAGGIPSASVASWDGASWSSLGSGIDGTVNALHSHAGKIFVGGSFGRAGGGTANNIAFWEAGNWHRIGSGVVGVVNDLAEFNGEVILGGNFTVPGDPGGPMNSRNLARIVDTNFLSLTHNTDNIKEIRTLFVDGLRIYTGGDFVFHPDPSFDRQKFDYGALRNIGYQYHDPSDTVRGVCCFTPWVPMAEGANGPVNAIGRLGDRIIVGGSFTTVGEINAPHVAAWSIPERQWHPLVSAQLINSISALALVRQQLYGVGPFVREKGIFQSLGTNQIARLGTRGWHRVAGTIYGDALEATDDGQDMLVGGRFISGGGVIAVNILEWNAQDQNWSAITPGSGVASQEDISSVRSILPYGNYLYVAGDFNVVDTFETPNVARFDRSRNVWEPLGEGLDRDVWGLAVESDGTLYAAGDFRHSGTTPINGVARWSGITWEPLGEGILNGEVRSIAVGNGRVFVGGTFKKAGEVDAINVAAWNIAEERWEPVGQGLTSDLLPGVDVLRFIGDRLFAGGFFRVSGADSMQNIARYNGSQWEGLGSGLDFASFEIVGNREDIYVAGSFAKAGSKPSPYIALWHDPTLSVEPEGLRFAGSLFGSPNPTAGAMLIRYTLPSPTDGRIIITDATGRDVAELYSGPMEAGEHALRWSATELPSGIYLCRLVTAEGTIVEKVVVRN